MFSDKAVFLDLETTGASPDHDRITEVGMGRVEHGEFVDEWSTLVNPKRPIPAIVSALTGITDEMVSQAPTFEQLAPTLLERLQDCLLIAHNARFDYGFLRAEFHRLGVLFASRVLCTVRLSRRLFPQERHHNLDSVMQRFRISCAARHRALGDAQVIWSFARELRRCTERHQLVSSVAALTQHPLELRISNAARLRDLPTGCGVYVFYARDGSALCVGKGSNLRSRIYADLESGTHARLELEHGSLEWIETAGELGASLHERALIRELAPRYNRNYKSDEAWSIAWQPAGVEIVDLKNGHEGSSLYGLFRRRADAVAALRGLARAYELCPVILGLEASGGPCTAYAEHACRGACIGREPAIAHMARLITALVRLRVPAWAFNGPIVVREHDARRALREAHVFDRWRYIGTARTDVELTGMLEQHSAPDFDIEHYKIIRRYLSLPHPRFEQPAVPRKDRLVHP